MEIKTRLDIMHPKQGRSEGGPGVPVTPPCKPFFKQNYNIPWRKRHDDNVWHSVTSPLKHPGYAPAKGITQKHFTESGEGELKKMLLNGHQKFSMKWDDL